LNSVDTAPLRTADSDVSSTEALADENIGLARRIGTTIRGFAVFGRRHRGLFFKGTFAAIGVVAARLALPWPLRAVAEVVTDADFSMGISDEVNSRILQLLFLFLLCVAALGLLDYLARLFFSRFAISTTRDLRQAVFGRSLGIDPANREIASGDLVSRLVGDAARVKAGMQGFLLHVATNGLLFAGVTVILWTIDPRMGLFFTLAAVMIGLIIVWGTRRIFLVSLQNRRKEGKLADKIYSSLRRPQRKSTLRRINKSSSRYEASLTRMQGRVTWIAHLIFGLAVVGSLWSGVRAVATGDVTVSNLVLFMFYVLMIGGPITRLARQGTRTGKILGPAYRLVQMLQPKPVSDGPAAVLRLRSLKKKLVLKGLRSNPYDNTKGTETDPLWPTVVIKRGERIAVVDASGITARFLLEAIAGERDIGRGTLKWDSAVLKGNNRLALRSQVSLFTPEALTANSIPPLAQRFRQIATGARRRVSIWCYLNPAEGLSTEDGKHILSSLSASNFSNSPTIIVATRHQYGLENYDRIINVENGRIAVN